MQKGLKNEFVFFWFSIRREREREDARQTSVERAGSSHSQQVISSLIVSLDEFVSNWSNRGRRVAWLCVRVLISNRNRFADANSSLPFTSIVCIICTSTTRVYTSTGAFRPVELSESVCACDRISSIFLWMWMFDKKCFSLFSLRVFSREFSQMPLPAGNPPVLAQMPNATSKF